MWAVMGPVIAQNPRLTCRPWSWQANQTLHYGIYIAIPKAMRNQIENYTYYATKVQAVGNKHKTHYGPSPPNYDVDYHN
jgi:hypothetical protein